jgi:hypothetical protein
MIDVIRLGYASSPHGRWIAEWVKEQLLHDNAAVDIQLIPVTSSLIGFAEPAVIPDALTTVDIVVVDGSFLPTKDAPGVVVAAVCERADPRQSIIGDGDSITVWHPSLAAVLHVTDPCVSVDIDSSLIDAFDDGKKQRQSGTYSTIMPMHAASRLSGQRLGQTPIEAEDMLPICGQGSVLVYTNASDVDLGTFIFGVLNVVETRREITVERFFKAQLQDEFHDTVCCYSTGSDRFLYLFVTMVIKTTLYKTRSGAHITALSSIVEQAISDLERQSGRVLRLSEAATH